MDVTDIIMSIEHKICDIKFQTGLTPNKIVLGVDVYRLLYKHLCECLVLSELGGYGNKVCKLMGIDVEIDIKNPNTLKVCIESDVILRKY